MGYAKRKQKQMGTYGQGGFVMVYDSLRQSLAYKVMTPLEKLILIDWLRLYGRLSNFDKEPLPDGFSYTYSNCMELVDEKTFYNARKRILEIGFFTERHELKRLNPGSPDVFSPSTAWMEYVPTEMEQKKIDRAEHRKHKSLEQGNTRKRHFLEQNPQRRKKKTE